jgi:hypothetical protein
MIVFSDSDLGVAYSRCKGNIFNLDKALRHSKKTIFIHISMLSLGNVGWKT